MSAANESNVTTLLANLQKEISNINEKLNEVISNNSNLKKDLKILTAENIELYDLIYDIEHQTNTLNQYTRRENIEIRNIPERINQRNVEQYVLEVLESIGIKLVPYDLVAVHRLGKFIEGKNRNVIVRFVNRKNAFSCLRNAKKLAISNTHEYKKLYIIENLCPTYKKIFNYLYKLKKDNKIGNVWTFNGSVFFKKLNSGEDYCQKVDHIDDIQFFINDDL